MKFFNFLEVVKVEHLNNFKKVITRNNTGYEQVLIISNSKFLKVKEGVNFWWGRLSICVEK